MDVAAIDRYRGCLLGLACGDAVGTTVEFCERGTFEPVSDMIGRGPDGGYLRKTRDEVTGSGYCVESLEAALWCFATTDSFEAAVLAAANLGDDADTTAAIVGQIAGAHYGVDGIPARWLAKLAMREDIDQLARALFAR